jgi:oligopeptide transport system substrate-binding protein
MKHRAFIILSFLFLSSCEKRSEPMEAFSFHLFVEPKHLDATIYRGSSASYFFYNLSRGIYRIAKDNQLVEEGGECRWIQSTELICDLKDDYWSDGTPVTAQHYVDRFQHLVHPQTAAPRAHLLAAVQGASEILSGQWPKEKLAVQALSPRRLRIVFNNKDNEFLFKLASTALYPLHPSHLQRTLNPEKYVVNGPYQIQKWEFGQYLILKPNPHYLRGHKNRPLIKVYFIDSEMTAYRFYKRGQLSFLRRIPSQMIDTLRSHPDFFQQPMLRFDYIGFGKRLLEQPKLRQALVHAIDYESLKKVLGGLERPGCPSIPKNWMTQQTCYDFDLKKARSYLSQVPKSVLTDFYEFKVSHLGGDDIKKQAVFIQNQWKKNLGLNINVKQEEHKVLLQQLRQSPPDIFRKGVGLDRPTCFNALETFAQDSKSNFVQIQEASFAQTLTALQNSTPNTTPYQSLCQKGVDHLLNQFRLIPLGEMHFSLMARPKYSGWSLNGLNQLDLSQLHLTQQD